MYLISQLWWYLSLAFLLGALLGFLLWRMCNQPLLESRFERSRGDMAKRLALLEDERHKHAEAGSASTSDVAKLRSELAAVKALAEKSINDLALARDAEAKLRTDAAALEKRVAALKADAAADLKKIRAEAVAEAARSQSEDLMKVRGQVTAALATADEIKQLHAATKAQDAKLQSLTEMAAAAKRELEDAKARHAAELADIRREHEAALPGSVVGAAAGGATALASGLGSGSSIKSAETGAGEKPAVVLAAPRGGKADDLTLIWGVGRKLEKILNDAGFYHFDQIANWSDKEVRWVDNQLGEFTGRATRDKWIEQCRKLATGWRPQGSGGDKPGHA